MVVTTVRRAPWLRFLAHMGTPGTVIVAVKSADAQRSSSRDNVAGAV
jgi:hypothetical protein